MTFHALLPLEHARAIGPLGILLLVEALWAVVLSFLFIGIPAAYELPSLVLLPLIAFSLAGFYTDPNVFSAPASHPHKISGRSRTVDSRRETACRLA